MSKVIFITGASRGFGKIWTEAFLKRGDKVVASSRDISQLSAFTKQYGDSIYPIQLDVTSRAAAFNAVRQARDHFGRIDTLINNAGYGLFGAVEETTEQEARNQLEVNLFGLLWMTQAIIPIMRQQGQGHIINMASVLGLVSVPNLGLYNASKHAVVGVTETLATEVKQFGINVSLVEPNAYATDWSNASAIHTQAMPEYDELKSRFQSNLTADFFGDPQATTEAITKLVDAENPPLHLLMGKKALPWVEGVYKTRFAEWEQWNDIAAGAHGH